jgi:hypothetical protein
MNGLAHLQRKRSMFKGFLNRGFSLSCNLGENSTSLASKGNKKKTIKKNNNKLHFWRKLYDFKEIERNVPCL